MGEVISYEEKRVIAKGLDPKNKVNQKKLKTYFFKEDYHNLKLLDPIKIPFEKEELTLLYPGCGADILFPLIYLERLFPKVKTGRFLFVDVEDNLGIIKTILDEIGISFEENNNLIGFYWKNKLISLQFITQSIETYFNQQFHEPNPTNQQILNQQFVIDVYFERAFRIMRGKIPKYETKIIDLLPSGGILISDSGFDGADLIKVDVPKELSSYREMIIGIKKI